MDQDQEQEPKARKACINCRRQKMKCRIDSGTTCRRCQRAGLPCIFVPRANASAILAPSSLPLTEVPSLDAVTDILRRVQLIEEHLGLQENDSKQDSQSYSADSQQHDEALSHIWKPLSSLERCAAPPRQEILWRKSIVRYLWESFHNNMPKLHFLPKPQNLSYPHPLLLASMLFCSAVRGPREYADLAPGYFSILCSAISQMSTPNSEMSIPVDDTLTTQKDAFQAVLGLVLAALLNEGNVRHTGLWISIAYNLVLDHCPPQVDEKGYDWNEIFKGLQIVDLEHASLHLTCPMIPIDPPIPALRISSHDQLYRLSRMMHTGLSRFAGRGLPTIWSCFGDHPPNNSTSPYPFTAVDAAVIRDWAKYLDDWLGELARSENQIHGRRKEVFRQYVLHRLLVLSIYHPARGCDLRSSSITHNEQRELLVSARATLKLHLSDKSIWSNWDLVMITWAAIIVVQAVEAGISESDDFRNIRIHLDTLKEMNMPSHSLYEKLITRLEMDLSRVSMSEVGSQSTMPDANVHVGLDTGWNLFDHTIINQVIDPFWLGTNQI